MKKQLPSLNGVSKAVLLKNMEATLDQVIVEMMKAGYTKKHLIENNRAAKSLSDTRRKIKLKAQEGGKVVAQTQTTQTQTTSTSTPTPTGEFNFSSWCRNKIIQDPSLDYSGLIALSKAELTPKQRSGDKRILSNARKEIEERWGVPYDKMSHKSDGSINISQLVYLFVDKYPDGNEQAAMSFFAEDLIDLKRGHFSNAKSMHLQRQGKPQKKRSYKRKETGKRRAQFVSGEREAVEKSVNESWIDLETRIDYLIKDTRLIKDQTAKQLEQLLINCRRQASVGVVRSAD